MLILSILHNIAITKEQAKSLYNGEEINVVGASVPVWYFRGNTSEPAEEVFCNYTLTNQKTNSEFLVFPNEARDGYAINMPQLPDGYIPRSISNDVWRKMTTQEQMTWYEYHPVPKSAKNLLPVKEGGAAYLSFKEHSSTLINSRNIATIHVVEIKMIEALMDSLD